LAAGVAHSIRNPLTSIKMRLFSLERSLDLVPNQKEDLEVISEETRHLDTIIRNFLEYARPSKLRMQRISPSELIDMTLQLLRHRFKSYGVRLELVRTVPLPEILADPDQLKEVFMNILINACEAVGEGGEITIEEEEETQAPLGPVALIRIRDSGPGIPAELQEKVFEPFFSTKEEGTGLGLSISVRVIEQHGGQLTVKSEEGQGTTFVITLPCREDKSWTQS
jgi:signal transduction histidine kinase